MTLTQTQVAKNLMQAENTAFQAYSIASTGWRNNQVSDDEHSRARNAYRKARDAAAEHKEQFPAAYYGLIEVEV